MRPRRPLWWDEYCVAPYAEKGRSLVTGVDCWGLVHIVLPAEFGQPVDDFSALYPSEGKAGLVEARHAIEAQLPRWREVDWEEGAVGLFVLKQRPVHVAIATASPEIVLHADTLNGVDTVSITACLKWKGRLAGWFLPPVASG